MRTFCFALASELQIQVGVDSESIKVEVNNALIGQFSCVGDPRTLRHVMPGLSGFAEIRQLGEGKVAYVSVDYVDKSCQRHSSRFEMPITYDVHGRENLSGFVEVC